MITVKPSLNTQQTIQLSPSYRLPIAFVLLAIPLGFLIPWLSLIIGLFGLFLLVQTVAIRLTFTPMALEVYRNQTLIRQFPYAEWSNWQIFWEKVPILFYFREVKSIHFLPILFDPKTLKTCLETYCPRK